MTVPMSLRSVVFASSSSPSALAHASSARSEGDDVALDARARFDAHRRVAVRG